MSTRDPCPRCGSTRFEEVDGTLECDNGHQQEGGLQVGEDDEDFGNKGKVRRAKREKNPKQSRIYRGPKAYRLYLQAWQHILWKQCHALIHLKGYPSELWTIVRDLWTIRLGNLTQRLENPDDDTHGDAPANEGSTSKVSQDNKKVNKAIHNGDLNASLWDTISLNCVGILLLQQPLHLASVYKAIRNGEICFIRALQHVPVEMRSRLPAEYHGSLDTTTVPQPEDLQRAIQRLAKLYEKNYGIHIPGLNWKPMLLEHIRELALPLEIFPAVQHIATITKTNFDHFVKQEPQRGLIIFPETMMLALVVIATKLLFPWDSDEMHRCTRSPTEPAATGIHWGQWEKTRDRYKRTLEEARPIPPGKEIEVTDLDVLTMSTEQLDAYMDWFQQTWVSEGMNANDKIFGMFPLQQMNQKPVSSDQATDERRKKLRATQLQLRESPIVAETEAANKNVQVLRPGNKYQQFRKEDDLCDVAETFYKAAAEQACDSVRSLIRVVLHLEVKMVNWQRQRRRQEVLQPREENDLEDTATSGHRGD